MCVEEEAGICKREETWLQDTPVFPTTETCIKEATGIRYKQRGWETLDEWGLPADPTIVPEGCLIDNAGHLFYEKDVKKNADKPEDVEKYHAPIRVANIDTGVMEMVKLGYVEKEKSGEMVYTVEWVSADLCEGELQLDDSEENGSEFCIPCLNEDEIKTEFLWRKKFTCPENSDSSDEEFTCPNKDCDLCRAKKDLSIELCNCLDDPVYADEASDDEFVRWDRPNEKKVQREAQKIVDALDEGNNF